MVGMMTRMKKAMIIVIMVVVVVEVIMSRTTPQHQTPPSHQNHPTPCTPAPDPSIPPKPPYTLHPQHQTLQSHQNHHIICTPIATYPSSPPKPPYTLHPQHHTPPYHQNHNQPFITITIPSIYLTPPNPLLSHQTQLKLHVTPPPPPPFSALIFPHHSLHQANTINITNPASSYNPKWRFMPVSTPFLYINCSPHPTPIQARTSTRPPTLHPVHLTH